MLGIICRFIFVSSLHTHTSKTLLAHLCAFLQTLILPFCFWCCQRFASCCVSSVILCQSQRTVLSEHHRSFLFLVLSEVCILLCIICNSVSKSPEDSRLSEHHRNFLEVVGEFTDMSFRVRFHSFYDLSVINYCCFLIRSGRCWSLVVSKLLISPCPLFLL